MICQQEYETFPDTVTTLGEKLNGTDVGKEDKTHLSLAPRGSGGVSLREAAFNLKK